jgi:hypothetical protein
MAVAWAQLIFNVVLTLAVPFLLRIFQRRLESFDTSKGPDPAWDHHSSSSEGERW